MTKKWPRKTKKLNIVARKSLDLEKNYVKYDFVAMFQISEFQLYI